MKKRNLLICLGLASLLVVGAGVGISAKGRSFKEAKAVSSVSGSIGIELQYLVGDTAHYWDDGNAKLAIHIYNNQNVGAMCDFWSDLVTTTAGIHNYVIPFTRGNSDADPFAGADTKMNVYRFDPVVTNAADGFSNGKYWNHCDNLGIGNMLYVYDWNLVSSDLYYVGKDSSSWNRNEDSSFHFAKHTESGWEVYDNIAFNDNDQFKMRKGSSYFPGFSTHSSLDEIIVGDQTNNITCKTAGTYRIHFKIYDSNSYITTPVFAEADEWAQDFLGANCTATKTNWATSAASFALLDGAVRELFENESVIPINIEPDTWYQKAVQRYDFVIELYGEAKYSDFMCRFETQTEPSNVFNLLNNNARNVAMIVSITTIVASLSLFGFIFIRKRKLEK